MGCRIVTEAELPQVMSLWDYCFEKKEDPFYQWYFGDYCLRHNRVLGSFSEKDGHLQNMLHINPYHILLRGREEKAPYLVGIATDPADRGRHLTRELLRTSFRLLRGRDCAFALLMPVYAGIYQPYDFAFCYCKHVYEMPLSSLDVPAPSGNLRISHIDPDSLEKDLFADVYETLSEAYNGLPVRTDFQWRKLLAVHRLEKLRAAVAYHGSEPRGYMFYHISEDKTFYIQELAALTPDAKRTLLYYAKRHQSSADKLYWEAMEDDITYLGFADADKAGRTRPFVMARCFDAYGALLRYEPPSDCPDGQAVLSLSDNLLEENNLQVVLRVKNGIFFVELTDFPADTQVSAGPFTQLYFGACSFSQLLKEGRIQMQAYDPSVISFMDRLFPVTANFMNEYF